PPAPGGGGGGGGGGGAGAGAGRAGVELPVHPASARSPVITRPVRTAFASAHLTGTPRARDAR
ncbi:MAG: hypothetical protein F4Y71_07240, partial [Acidobacteria bacterium]|nr:hypothetical protein [Acidobacteriota bacterium]